MKNTDTAVLPKLKTAEGKIRELTIQKNIVTFRFRENENIVKQIELKTGYGFVAEKFFKKNVPDEIETEYAINYIEDELMSRRELLNESEQLYTEDSNLKAVFAKNNVHQAEYTQREVEDLFGKYANIVMGEPLSRSNLPFTKNDYALVLILREIVHHLKFESLHLV